MSIYEDRLSNALLTQKISEVEQRLSNLDPDAADRAQNSVPGGPERLGAVLEFATTVIGAADPELISQSQISQVAETLDHLEDRIQRFVAAEFEWPEVDGATDTLLDRLSAWPHAGGIPPAEVKEAASRFRRSAGMLLANIESDLTGVRDQVGEQQERAVELQAASEKAIAAADEQVGTLTSTIDEQKARLEEALKSNSEQFTDSQERRVEKFGEQETELQGRIAAVEGEAKQTFQEAEARYSQQMREAEERVQDHLDEAERIVGAIATTGTIGGFQQEANRQKSTADLLRNLALGAAVVAAGIAIWGVIHHATNSDSNATDLGAKALASFVIFGIAGYLATQSGKHRDREERARRRELELAAFGPFIDDLPEEKQQLLKENLAERIFGHEPPSSSGGEGLTGEDVSVVAQLFKVFRSGS
jgi:hypothetical protein